MRELNYYFLAHLLAHEPPGACHAGKKEYTSFALAKDRKKKRKRKDEEEGNNK